MKPVAVGAGSELLRRCRPIVRFVAEIRKSQVEYEPVGADIRRLVPVVIHVTPVYPDVPAVFIMLFPISDDEQVAHMDRVVRDLASYRRIALRPARQAQA